MKEIKNIGLHETLIEIHFYLTFYIGQLVITLHGNGIGYVEAKRMETQKRDFSKN